MKKALIIIDMQNDYFAGGNMALDGIEKAMDNTMRLIENALIKGYKIFFIQHISTRQGANFFLPDSEGAKLHKQFDLRVGTVIEKHYPNSFRETSLREKLQNKGINNLIICGAMSHMCVDTTTRAAFDLGYNTELIYDACATKDLIFQGKTIQAGDVQYAFMASLHGIFCKVKSAQESIIYHRTNEHSEILMQ